MLRRYLLRRHFVAFFLFVRKIVGAIRRSINYVTGAIVAGAIAAGAIVAGAYVVRAIVAGAYVVRANVAGAFVAN